jgi:hypothetical protein
MIQAIMNWARGRGLPCVPWSRGRYRLLARDLLPRRPDRVGLHRHARDRPGQVRPGHARPWLPVFSPPPPGHAGRKRTAAGHRRRKSCISGEATASRIAWGQRRMHRERRPISASSARTACPARITPWVTGRGQAGQQPRPSRPAPPTVPQAPRRRPRASSAPGTVRAAPLMHRVVTDRRKDPRQVHARSAFCTRAAAWR